MSRRPRVLFVCVKNGGKSQMAAGLMKRRSAGSVEVHSAGTQPGKAINSVSAAALAELGIDISHVVPKAVTVEAVEAADLVVTLGVRHTSKRSAAPRWRTGTPMNRLSVASRVWSGCGWFEMTSTATSSSYWSGCSPPTTVRPELRGAGTDANPRTAATAAIPAITQNIRG